MKLYWSIVRMSTEGQYKLCRLICIDVYWRAIETLLAYLFRCLLKGNRNCIGVLYACLLKDN